MRKTLYSRPLNTPAVIPMERSDEESSQGIQGRISLATLGMTMAGGFLKAAYILFVFTVLLPALTTEAATASTYLKDLALIDTGIVREVIKPDTLVLEGDKKYRLENIRIPADRVPAAVDELNSALLGKKVRIYAADKTTATPDRYGIPLAQVIREDGVWVQELLVSKGMAWAFSSEQSRKMMIPLRQKETGARRLKLGFWSDSVYAIKTTENVQDSINSFQVVEGKILSVAVKKDYAYLNFGQDWKKDFTVSLPKKYWRLFSKVAAKGFTVESWKNHTVRIRGWIENRNGPMIELTHPEQMEFIK